MADSRPTPLVQVRVIADPDHAQVLIADVAQRARQLLGPGVDIRTQTRSARRAGYVRLYLTAARRESP
ncbi:hypothetical protein KIF24_26680 [Micromonospora sp. Llam7]|uniref:hypothetical protein n=1 Tax=Micromonospora tarapacensis TaxID=2835305 RepID=UPI001C83112E|nr:hypothetical protein [Micromonospora tarapacensis]MBX7269251.1 hypothetical protein [Micromonospora tarapacensis]